MLLPSSCRPRQAAMPAGGLMSYTPDVPKHLLEQSLVTNNDDEASRHDAHRQLVHHQMLQVRPWGILLTLPCEYSAGAVRCCKAEERRKRTSERRTHALRNILNGSQARSVHK